MLIPGLESWIIYCKKNTRKRLRKIWAAKEIFQTSGNFPTAWQSIRSKLWIRDLLVVSALPTELSWTNLTYTQFTQKTYWLWYPDLFNRWVFEGNEIPRNVAYFSHTRLVLTQLFQLVDKPHKFLFSKWMKKSPGEDIIYDSFCWLDSKDQIKTKCVITF